MYNYNVFFRYSFTYSNNTREGRKCNKEGVACAKVATQEEHEVAQIDEWVVAGSGTTVGATCTHGWNYAQTS